MQVPGFGRLDWFDWIRGLVGAFIGGAAGAIGSGVTTSTVIEPSYIASHEGLIWKMMWQTALYTGTIGAALYLKQKSTPDLKVTERMVESKQVGEKPPVVTETLKETTVSTEPVKDLPKAGV